MALVLWGREQRALDCGVRDAVVEGLAGLALAHNVRSEAEVDEVVAAAEAAGATVTRRPARTFYGGYAGCFSDLDGRVWEIAHSPGFPLAEDASTPFRTSARRGP